MGAGTKGHSRVQFNYLFASGLLVSFPGRLYNQSLRYFRRFEVLLPFILPVLIIYNPVFRIEPSQIRISAEHAFHLFAF